MDVCSSAALIVALLLILMAVELNHIRRCFEDENCRKNWKSDRKMLERAGILTASLFFTALISYIVYVSYHIPIFCVSFLVLLPILFIFMLTSVSHTIHEFRKISSEQRKKMTALLISTIFLISFVFTIYMGVRYIAIPNVNEEYLIEIENPNRTSYYILIPNLLSTENPHRYMGISNYIVEKGKCTISTAENGKYLNISSDSPELVIKHHIKGDFINEARVLWRFPEQLLQGNTTEGYYITTSFYPSEDSNVTLKLKWSLSKSSNLIGGIYEIFSGNASLKTGINEVKINHSISVAD